MATDVTTVQSRVGDILNQLVPGTFAPDFDPNNFDRNQEAVAEAVRESALLIARAILSNPEHVHRNLFVSSTPVTLTNESELPDLAANISLIEIQGYSGGTWLTGTPLTIQQIESYRNDTLKLYDPIAHNANGSRLGGYYAISNGRFYFSGFAARAYLPLIDGTTVQTLIPDEYQSAWVALSVSLCMKEGDNLMPEAEFYQAIGQRDLVNIANMSIMEPMPTPEKAKQVRGNV